MIHASSNTLTASNGSKYWNFPVPISAVPITCIETSSPTGCVAPNEWVRIRNMQSAARVNTRPQLVIDADDVKCTHGATVGQLDDEAMFYLRSRGIGESEARLMMMFGFAHEIVGRVRLAPLREQIDDLVDKRLRGELTKCYNCVLHCQKTPPCST